MKNAKDIGDFIKKSCIILIKIHDFSVFDENLLFP